MQVQNRFYKLLTDPAGSGSLWGIQLLETGKTLGIEAPSVEIDGQVRSFAGIRLAPAGTPQTITTGVTQYIFAGSDSDGFQVQLTVRVADDNPVIRFKYSISSAITGSRLTKESGKDKLAYMAVSFAEASKVKEVRLSEFNELLHSFVLAEHEVKGSAFENRLRPMGPILVGETTDGHAILTAYEHGSQVPDAYVAFQLEPGGHARLEAVKGNYFAGQPIGDGGRYETIWLQAALIEGDEETLARHYRSFVLHAMSPNAESRKPYIYYNTWAFQERNKFWNGKTYLDSMNEERILAEIDVAYRMGIEVFVIDTGWYVKTGDWEANRQRFSDGLRSVKAKLDGYGMKLGLWFDPLAAGITSRILQGNEGSVLSWKGIKNVPHEIWETEKSHKMCLVSEYKDVFADELIRLVRELGVTYFKWDAIGQYGCSDPSHHHGTEVNSDVERADCYAFSIGRAMSDIVDRLCSVCPEAIVDFDITEGHRYVGLGFLSSGKYFLINNGPYYHNYNIPCPEDKWINIFVYPGPARPWICRTPLTFDKWIPSVLFLTHYLPDDPEDSQVVNVASLILGQNGIWGDLLTVSDTGVSLIGDLLAGYKQVRNDITEAYPVIVGKPGGSPEIYEKVNHANGRGALVVFSNVAGAFTYVTESAPSRTYWAQEGVTIRYDDNGRAVVELAFTKPGSAKIIYFGIDSLNG
ncbi:alpha-galactosidase [Paenibacillus silvisoli]|uniref:alpha-galactosidase n=1 Tax=Paenibacillus silvisoli TaxID=3110539 RepID=UPI0028058664|nr:alpha-galactosidase [Paenibacillus silvisoli]